ncbi:MAG: Mut7-C RNAse domain-containing protein [Chthoniobacterales bacterium]
MKAPGDGKSFRLQFHFHGDLPFFVRPTRGANGVVRQLQEKTSVKDAIEACGVPHPEIDLILRNDAPVSFRDCVASDAKIDVYPVTTNADLFPNARLQRRNIHRFVADGHLGKLTRDLRLLGLDVAYLPIASDAELVAVSVAENRALLTRDRLLLMRTAVTSGYYPRSQRAEEQTREVIVRFDLGAIIAPFTRCLRCNGFLAAVSKSDVLGKLEPLTKIYYENFRRCRQCGQIYWSGSHFEKLQKRIERLLGD